MRDVTDETPSGVVMRRLSDVPVEPIKWLWPGRFALGKLSLITGNPGGGKSQLTAYMAARVSTGTAWPLDEGQAPAGQVIMLSAEDDPADTIRPRLEAAGGDSARIHVLEAVREEGRQRSFNLVRDVEHLAAIAMQMSDLVTVFIDPLTAYLGRTDSHKNAEVRAALSPLTDLAIRRGFAIVGVTHNAKSGGAAATSAIGSVAFSGAARAMFLVSRDSDDPTQRLFLPAKNNLGPDTGGLAFRIVERGMVTAVEWLGPVDISADDALSTGRENGGRSAGINKAMRFLRKMLGDGPMVGKEVEKEAKRAGISVTSLRKARERMGGVTRPQGGAWWWSLPEEQASMAFDPDSNDVPF